ncbi:MULTISPECIES: hypothetical protein [Tsukamurella]|uniref:Uncharacterized protein n=2 Tax=Tsukamurella TaxID=2060 RepID=A0A5C5S457_9ACTN|nr:MULTISPECIES: hypothetical protein [Tsukamurella]NMD55174.1 hypothetical protein [Tsukamurella columbiensis]TWS30197.1 hypothetical protein FK530_06715 [Tsukamurella conjunctivitidis]
MKRRPGLIDRLRFLPAMPVDAILSPVPNRARRILNSWPVTVLVDGLVWVLNLRSIARKAGR